MLYILAKLIKRLHFAAIKNSAIDNTAKICPGCHIVSSELGRYSYVGSFSTILNARIGNFCSIADQCVIGGASHPIDWVSTSPVFHKGRNILKKNFHNFDYTPGKITDIGNDVWMGYGVYVKSGIHIGDGAVIGMGAVVTKDVGDYEIWGGNPAKLIKKRFTEETIAKLTKSEWWNEKDIDIVEIAHLFNDVERFIDTIERGKIG